MKLSGKNFQSWGEFNLDISGLTVLTGLSNSGKSAVFRALKGVLRNELPADFVRDGQDDAMEVTVEVEGHTITAKRTPKGSTTYIIDGKDYAKLAKVVPESLKALKFNEIIIGDFDIDPIFGRQNSAQFLIDPLTYKPTEVNTILGAFGGTEKLEAGKKEANLRKTQKDSEARMLAEQIRESEERKAALVIMQVEGEKLNLFLHDLDNKIKHLETGVFWFETTAGYCQKILPLRQIADALVLPDITGLNDLYIFISQAEEAAETTAYARWLQKPQAAFLSVTKTWGMVQGLWNEIGLLNGAVEAGKHIVSTDKLQTVLSSVEEIYSKILRLRHGIKSLDDLAKLLQTISTSTEKLDGVEMELSTLLTELKKSLCPVCNKSLEHVCNA